MKRLFSRMPSNCTHKFVNISTHARAKAFACVLAIALSYRAGKFGSNGLVQIEPIEVDHEYMAPDIRCWQTHFETVAELIRMEAKHMRMNRIQNDAECWKNDEPMHEEAACREE